MTHLHAALMLVGCARYTKSDLNVGALQGQRSFLEQLLFRANAPAMYDKHYLTL